MSLDARLLFTRICLAVLEFKSQKYRVGISFFSINEINLLQNIQVPSKKII